ncbi:IS1 family transposase, partial [Escherichia coli]
RQQWHWYAYTTKSGGVLAYTFGPRTDETCRELPELLKPFSTGMITRDNRSSYTREMPQDKHPVGKIFTRRIERNHLTLRTHIKRPARKTICFSRSLEIHEKPLVHLSKTLYY